MWVHVNARYQQHVHVACRQVMISTPTRSSSRSRTWPWRPGADVSTPTTSQQHAVLDNSQPLMCNCCSYIYDLYQEKKQSEFDRLTNINWNKVGVSEECPRYLCYIISIKREWFVYTKGRNIYYSEPYKKHKNNIN
jgi:hypothetical protein